MGHFKKLLVAVDFSDGSERALQRGVDLARASGAELHVVSVHDIPLSVAHMGVGVEAGLPGGVFDVLEQLREELQKKLDDLKKRYADSGVKVVIHLSEGAAVDSIIGIADDIDADMLILGTHGRTGMQHLLIGSVAERVVRMAHRPVLTVPLPRAEA